VACSWGGHQITPSGRTRYACKYRFYSEFQSHEGEFDYLKSLEIEEKINQIKWCKKANHAQFLLSCNGEPLYESSWPLDEPGPYGLVLVVVCLSRADKTVKLWKIHDRKIRAAASQITPRHDEACRPRTSSGDSSIQSLRFPRLYTTGSVVTATPRRVFRDAHAYHINSLSTNSDGENFLSADDLRINLWNMEVTNRSFSEWAPRVRCICGWRQGATDELFPRAQTSWTSSPRTWRS
jgi:serine/threonine-protein phosphatase 2A regulatory subunit B